MYRHITPVNANNVTMMYVQTFCAVPIAVLLFVYHSAEHAVSHVNPNTLSGLLHFNRARSLTFFS